MEFYFLITARTHTSGWIFRLYIVSSHYTQSLTPLALHRGASDTFCGPLMGLITLLN